MTTTLLIGGRIYSPSHPDATAMAVRDDVVVWLGQDQVGRALHPDAQVIDLRGAFVAPAFVDSHVHLTSTGLTLVGLDLRAATSKAHCLALIAGHTAAGDSAAGDTVLWGHGWDDTAWADGAAPTLAELDAATGGRPAYLSRVDVHSALASSALRARVPDLAAATGYDPHGPLAGDAHHAVRAQARALLSPPQLERARRAALDAFAAAGVVAVHECAGPQIGGLQDWQEIRDVDHAVEVTGYWGQAVRSADEARELIAATGARGLAGDLFVDGALGSRTAWLHEPYADGQGCGTCHLDPDAVVAHLLACTEAQVPAGFHVIGDRAVSVVVDALEQVVDRLGVAAVARCGHRLEHLEMVTADQAAKLGAWGVIASMQPVFDALWGGPDGMYARRLGVERAAGLNPFALLASQGVPLAFGSDAPVTDIAPWAAVGAATRHHTEGSSISPRSAFAAATRGAWRAAGVRDGMTGTLVPGAPASYAVWETGELEVAVPDDAVQRWSTTPGSRIPPLPPLGHDDPLPQCRATVHRGRLIHGTLDG